MTFLSACSAVFAQRCIFQNAVYRFSLLKILGFLSVKTLGRESGKLNLGSQRRQNLLS